MSAGTQARADRRALFSAAWLGSGFGLCLAVAYVFAGLAPTAHEHLRAVRLAKDTRGDVGESMLQRSMNVNDTGAFLLARAHESLLMTGSAVSAAQGWPGQLGAHPAAARRESPLTAQRELDCMTEAVYFEARSESPRGQAAVAQVVMNRLGNPNFPKTVCGVVFQGAAHPGCQFSFACDGSMRQPLELAAWDRARDVAEKALEGVRVAAIGNATHYHTTDVDPYWRASMLRVAQVGMHIFYRRNPHAPVERDEDTVERALFTNAPASPVAGLKLASAVVAKSSQAVLTAAQPKTTAGEPHVAPHIDIAPHIEAAHAAEAAAVPAADTAEPAAS